MEQPPKLPERLATVEANAISCRVQQDERHKEIMGRIRRIEDRWNLLLGAVILSLLGIVANIAIALLKK